MSNKKRLTSEQQYQRDYYQENKEQRSMDLSDRWHNDPAFKRAEQERAQRRRGVMRAEKAQGRFEAMVESKREIAVTTRPPRFVRIGRRDVQVWTSGSLGREVGRSARTIRSWLNRGILPGATAYIHGHAWFSRKFCEAVYSACRRLYYLDGRGDGKVLKRLVKEEMAKANIKFVPLGQDNYERVSV